MSILPGTKKGAPKVCIAVEKVEVAPVSAAKLEVGVETTDRLSVEVIIVDTPDMTVIMI